MELSTVSLFFDRTPIQDVVSGATLFFGQIKPYEEAVRDSATTYRRILSVAPALRGSVPEKIKVFGEVWMVGASQVDGWAAQHRVKFIIHRAAGQADVFTPAGFLSGTKSFSVHADFEWVADRKELEASSYVPQDFMAYMPRGTTVSLGSFVVLNGACVFVESTLQEPSGLSGARGRKQREGATTTCVVEGRVYSQAAGGFTGGASATVNCFVMRWQDSYTYLAQTDEKYREGDVVILLPAGTAASTSSKLTVQGVTWAVVQARTLNGVVNVHARLA